MKTIAEAALAFITALLLSGCNYLSSGTESPSMPIYSSSSSSTTSNTTNSTTSITEEVIPAAESDITPDVSRFDLSAGKNQHAPTVKLNSGYEMPVAGIGTYSLQGDTCVNALKSALEQGVRLIDTAYMYGNEKEVGQAVREFMAETDTPREEIFVITKIYPGEQFKNPEKAIQDALDKLDIEYIDMMLLHHPGDNDVKAYKASVKSINDLAQQQNTFR